MAKPTMQLTQLFSNLKLLNRTTALLVLSMRYTNFIDLLRVK